MTGASLAAALGAGLLSFLSPCVLPLVPAYLSYLSGYGLGDLGSRTGQVRARLFSRSLAFTLGFTLVFVALGLVFAGGGFLAGGSRWIKVASGLAVLLLGLNLLFDFLTFLNLEKRFQAKRPAAQGLAGLGGAFVLGVAFAAGWSPCIGPILASILLLAARDGSLVQGGALLFSYSLGLALPFLAAGLAFDRVRPILDWAKKRGRGIRIVAGLFLTGLGLLMALGKLGLVSSLASRLGFGLKASLIERPGLFLTLDLLAYGLAAALILLPGLLRRFKTGDYSYPRLGKILALTLLVCAAMGEAIGIWSLAGLVAHWLTFQGG